jgi:hypothetical protein
MKYTMKAQLILWTCLGILATSCAYDQVVPEDPVITEPVSFQSDIIPIFNQACNMGGCHNGTIPPDLRAANAFNALNSGGYINTSNPSGSELYLWMRGEGGRLSMPPGGTNATYNAKVLAWIEQGAKNN